MVRNNFKTYLSSYLIDPFRSDSSSSSPPILHLLGDLVIGSVRIKHLIMVVMPNDFESNSEISVTVVKLMQPNSLIHTENLPLNDASSLTDPQDVSNLTALESVRIACQPGQVLSDHSSGQMTLDCGVDGSWSNSVSAMSCQCNV